MRLKHYFLLFVTLLIPSSLLYLYIIYALPDNNNVQKDKICGYNKERNFIENPSFTSAGDGWDLRWGAGQDRGYLGVIDNSIYRTGPSSLKVPPSDHACDTGECDRTVWQDHKIPLKGGEKVKLSGWVRIESCCEGEGCTSHLPCWVNPSVEGITEYGKCNGLPYCDKGGARLGMDFRDKDGNVIDFDMRTVDWTMEVGKWHCLEMVYDAPEEARSVMVWIQGFQYNAPASIWLDDVFLTKGQIK